MIASILPRRTLRSAMALWALALAAALCLTLAPATDASAASKSSKGKTVAKSAAAKSKKKASASKKEQKSHVSLEKRIEDIERRAEEKARLQRELDARVAALESASETDLLERIDAGESLDLEMVGETYWHSLGTSSGQNPLVSADELPEMPIVGPLAEGAVRYEIKTFGSRYALAMGFPQIDPSRTLPSITPILGKGYYISSDFGPRRNPKRRKGMGFHGGIDIAGAFKSPIVASADGIVEASHFQKGYGNVVWVRHREGLITGYAHLTKRVAKPGQFVSRGDLLGYMGRTGRATGVHLHYVVINDGRFVDPFPFLGRDLTASKEIASNDGEVPSHPQTGNALPLVDLIKQSFWGSAPQVSFPEYRSEPSTHPVQTSGIGSTRVEVPAGQPEVGPLAALSGQSSSYQHIIGGSVATF